MPIAPHKNEDQQAWMQRCVPEMIGTGDNKRPNDQAVAICLDIWRQRDKSLDDFGDDFDDVTPDPEDDEGLDEFMDRCTEAVQEANEWMPDEAAEELCQIRWDETKGKSASGRALKRKTHSGPISGAEYILSDETVDRMGDIISSDGWDLSSFAKNPIALFNHSPSAPIGRWSNLRVEGRALRGHLELAPEGTSPRIDEIRKLVAAGILKAVSVGFREVESTARKSADGRRLGQHFLKQELVETSLVSVPANPNAIAVAKGLNISPATLKVVFAGQGEASTTLQRRGFTGGQAKTSRVKRKGLAMSLGLGQRIVELQQQIVADQESLAKHLGALDDSNVSEDDLNTTTAFNQRIAAKSRQHLALVESEKLIGATLAAEDGAIPQSRSLAIIKPQSTAVGLNAPIVLRERKKELEPLEYFGRALAIGVAAKAWNTNPIQLVDQTYGGDEPTKGMVELVLRAASAPAITTVATWAAELVHQIYTDLMPLLMPHGILTRLAPRGLALNFGRAGRIIIPNRNRTPTVAGSFVGEGQAIPVRQAGFGSQTLTPKKVAVISTYTREMDQFSIPAIEGVLREAIQQDTEVAVDSILLDANPATVIRPAGLLNGVAGLTATAATNGPLAAIIGDLKMLIGALATSTYGNIRSPVFLINPEEVLAASLASAPNTGIFPFRDEVARGALNNIPFIDSAVVPLKTVILLDAADFVVAGAEGPRVEFSDSATLHMEDTSPADLVTAGSPGVVAAPQRSLFQTDSLAIRMIMFLNWVQRRAGTVVWTSSVNWT
jgi:HK97 family phage prohead protease